MNVLNRQFEAQRPSEKLITDMAHIRVTEVWLDLGNVIDLFNSDVVDFLMSKQLYADFAINTLNALSYSDQVPQAACILNSARDLTYTHEQFVEALKTKGFTKCFSRVGTCWDYTCAVSFFEHLKAKLGITHQN